MSRSSWAQGAVQLPNGSTEADELRASFLSSLAWSNDLCHRAKVHALVRRQEFPSWTWAAWQCLLAFSRKSIAIDFQSPSVAFQSRQDQRIELEDYGLFLGSSNSVMLFQPYILLSGWVTKVWFSEAYSGKDEALPFQVQQPVPTHRVSVVMDTNALTQFRRDITSNPSPILLLGDESCERSTKADSYGWRDVHAIIMQRLPDGTHRRLGVVTWSALGFPSVSESQDTMKVNELVEARRVVPRCQCGCQMSTDNSFDRYLEDDSHVMEFKKANVFLV